MTEEQAKANIPPRYRKFYEARQAGFSYADIGRDKKISRERARHIVLSADRRIKALMSDEDGWEMLSVRARNCISSYFDKWLDSTFRASKADVRKAIVSDGWNLLKSRNLGKKTAAEICKWAGVPKMCPCCGQIIKQ